MIQPRLGKLPIRLDFADQRIDLLLASFEFTAHAVQLLRLFLRPAMVDKQAKSNPLGIEASQGQRITNELWAARN